MLSRAHTLGTKKSASRERISKETSMIRSLCLARPIIPSGDECLVSIEPLYTCDRTVGGVDGSSNYPPGFPKHAILE